jgi:hypothetical protein
MLALLSAGLSDYLLSQVPRFMRYLSVMRLLDLFLSFTHPVRDGGGLVLDRFIVISNSNLCPSSSELLDQ